MSGAIHKDFEAVDRFGDTIYVHKSAPVWIVCYPEVKAVDYMRPTYWQGYRALDLVKKGRPPWSVDNKKISDRGFATLSEAFEAASYAAEQLALVEKQ